MLGHEIHTGEYGTGKSTSDQIQVQQRKNGYIGISVPLTTRNRSASNVVEMRNSVDEKKYMKTRSTDMEHIEKVFITQQNR